MSKPRYKWWGYARAMIRAYPEHCNDNEREAVSRSLQELEHYPTAEARRSLITRYFFDRQTIRTAVALNIPPPVAEKWISDFIHSVWRNFCDLTSN